MLRVQSIEISSSGRVFLVGGLSGHFSILYRLLTEVSFNSRIDRLLLLGNFIGFSPSSRQVSSWLDKPWVSAVIGPSEAAVLDRLSGRPVCSLIGQWLNYLNPVEKNHIKQSLDALPFALELQTARGLVVASNFSIKAGASWNEQKKSALNCAYPSVFESINSMSERVGLLTALGEIRSDPLANVADVDFAISSAEIEAPPTPFISHGNRYFLLSSAHMNHGNHYDSPCLVSYCELSGLIGITEDLCCKGHLETLVR